MVFEHCVFDRGCLYGDIEHTGTKHIDVQDDPASIET